MRFHFSYICFPHKEGRILHKVKEPWVANLYSSRWESKRKVGEAPAVFADAVMVGGGRRGISHPDSSWDILRCANKEPVVLECASRRPPNCFFALHTSLSQNCAVLVFRQAPRVMWNAFAWETGRGAVRGAGNSALPGGSCPRSSAPMLQLL